MGECAGKISYCVKNLNFKFDISNRKAASILGLDFSIKPDYGHYTKQKSRRFENYKYCF